MCSVDVATFDILLKLNLNFKQFATSKYGQFVWGANAIRFDLKKMRGFIYQAIKIL